MTLLPIVERELRIRSRGRGTLRLRMGVALISFLIVAALLVSSQAFVSPGSIGKTMFSILSGLAFLGCLLEGVRVTADCLSEEKRRGTLGLLFLTDLRGYDVVLGKFMAVSLASIYGLIAILPALAVPITMGGVSGAEFWRMVLVLLNTLFFSLSVGMLVSTLSFDERRAWLATLLIIAAAALIPVFAELFQWGSVRMMAAVSPTMALIHAYEDGYSTQANLYWTSTACLNVYSWLCLALACFLLPRNWQASQPAPRPANKSKASPAAGAAPGIQWKPTYRSPRYESNPLSWLVGQGREYSWAMKWFIAVVGVGALAGWGATGFDPDYGLILLIVALGLHLFLASWVGVEACSTMSEARDSGLLELLLTTPLSVPQIVRGYQDGLWRFFTRPVILMACVDLVGLLIYGARKTAEVQDPSDLLGLLFLVGLLLAVSLLDLVAAGSYGLWMGLVSRKPSQAITKTLLYVVWLPAVGNLCCPILLGSIKNAVFANVGSDRLLHRLRLIVTGWYTEGEGGLPEVPVLHSKRKDKDLPSVLPPELPGGAG